MEETGRFRRHKSSEISSAELVRECGRKLGDRHLWQLFTDRFEKPIYLYLMRVLKFHSKRDDVTELIPELAQEVYIRLCHDQGIMMQEFRGENDFSVKAFFARVCSSVSIDYLRRNESQKRFGGNVVSIEEAREKEAFHFATRDFSEMNEDAILKWIDVGRLAADDPDPKNAKRNAIIFKLHFIDGLTTEEISAYPGFELTEKGVGSVITRLRKRIRT
jgi:DNA-directed RNA polymerase specialized sigma24 family protein